MPRYLTGAEVRAGLVDCNYAEFWAALNRWGLQDVLMKTEVDFAAGLLSLGEVRAALDLPPIDPDTPTIVGGP